MASQLTKPQSTCLLQHFGYLNTYLLSKTLTERMVMEHHQASFSVCIVSRALCGAVAGLPCPGYIGNTSGATAAILAVATDIHPVSVMHTSGVLGVRTEQARTCIKEGTGSDERLMLGCKTWKDLGSSSMDRNMPFLCDSAKKLSEGQLSLHHSGQCLVWNDRPEHVWDQHTSSHAAGVDNKRYLQKRKQ
ncbi:hypothetical protein WJX79_002930 [Trebouxia sp. C0005]